MTIHKSKFERSEGTCPSDVRAWRQGVQLAIAMLCEADDGSLDQMALQAHHREGRPQDNLVLRYLRKVREVDDARVEAAFASVLTDCIASAVGGTFPDIDAIETWARWPIVTSAEASHA